VLVELGVTEQRYRAVLEVLEEGASRWPAGMGWRARRSMGGWPGMPMTVAWLGWRIARRGRRRARIR
jgi:hypothetical protein